MFDKFLLSCCFQELLCLCLSVLWLSSVWCGFLWVYHSWSLVCFLDLKVSIELEKLFGHVFPFTLSASFSLCSPSGTHRMGMLSPRLCLPFCFICFSFFSSDLIISFILYLSLLIHFYSWSYVLLNSSNEFWLSILYFSAPDLLFGSFEKFVSLLIFSFCSYIVFLISFHSVFSFSFEHIQDSFKIFF